MPDVTINPGEYEKYSLKTAPPDGFIMLRPLPFGMKLSRRSKATRMMMRMPTANKTKQQQTDAQYELESMDEMTVQHDFAYCVGDHNLTDSNGEKLDFTNPMTLKLLNPKVGTEIETLINNLNEDEDEETLEDFLARSTGSSEVEDGSLKEGGNANLVTPSVDEVTILNSMKTGKDVG